MEDLVQQKISPLSLRVVIVNCGAYYVIDLRFQYLVFHYFGGRVVFFQLTVGSKYSACFYILTESFKIDSFRCYR
jgi:hypothetical protein